jgi:hypothetical protein
VVCAFGRVDGAVGEIGRGPAVEVDQELVSCALVVPECRRIASVGHDSGTVCHELVEECVRVIFATPGQRDDDCSSKLLGQDQGALERSKRACPRRHADRSTSRLWSTPRLDARWLKHPDDR